LTFCQFLYNQCIDFHVGVNLSTLQQYFQTNNINKKRILKGRQVSVARLGVGTKDSREALGTLRDILNENPAHQPAALMMENNINAIRDLSAWRAVLKQEGGNGSFVV
jgi:hypothetical protein